MPQQQIDPVNRRSQIGDEVPVLGMAGAPGGNAASQGVVSRLPYPTMRFEELRGRGYDGTHDSVRRFVKTGAMNGREFRHRPSCR